MTRKKLKLREIIKSLVKEQRDIKREKPIKGPIKDPIKDPKRVDFGTTSAPVKDKVKGPHVPNTTITGCTDPAAINYDPEAEIACGEDANNDCCYWFECRQCNTLRLEIGYNPSGIISNYSTYWAPLNYSDVSSFGIQGWSGSCPSNAWGRLPNIHMFNYAGANCDGEYGWTSNYSFHHPCNSGISSQGWTGYGGADHSQDYEAIFNFYTNLNNYGYQGHDWVEDVDYPGYEDWETLEELCKDFGADQNGNPIN